MPGCRRCGAWNVPHEPVVMKFLRNTDEWVGLLVLVCIGLFIASVLHAGLLSDWFRPTATLRVVLPETGSQGLSAGADVELLGTGSVPYAPASSIPAAGCMPRRNWKSRQPASSGATARLCCASASA